MKIQSILCLMLFVLLTGCPKPAKQVVITPPHKQVVKTNNEQAKVSFEKAVYLLESKQYQQSIQAFKIVRAEHPNDPVAPASRLYMARAMMGDVQIKQDGSWVSTTKPEQIKAAVQSLSILSQDADLDVQLRYAAMIYKAIGHGVLGQIKAAMATLKPYASGSMSALVLKADRVAGFRVLSAALLHHKRYKMALLATANLRAAREAQNIANKVQGKDIVMIYATSKAFELASTYVDAKALHLEFVVSKDALLQASAGSALIHKYANDTTPMDETRRKLVEDLYNRTTAALTQLGLPERVRELSRVMVTLSDQRKLVIGAALPLSGKAKPIGLRAMRGLLVAQQAYERASKASVTLVFEDANDPASEVFARLKKQGALAIIGPLDKSRAKTYSTLATAAKLPLIMLTAKPLPSSDIKAQDAFVFRHFIHASAEAQVVAKLSATTYKHQRIVVVSPDIPYGQLMRDAFVDTLKKHQKAPVLVVSYDRKKNNYTTLARQIARAKPDAIFIPDTADKVSQLSAFLAKENVWGRAPNAKPTKRTRRQWVNYLGTSLWQDARLIQQAATYVTGASIPTWYSPTFATKRAKRFTQSHRTIFGVVPSIYEAFAYDAMMWLRDLTLSRGLRRPVALRDALLNKQGFDGVTGHARFHPWGEPDRKIQVVSVRTSGFVSTPLSQTILATPVQNKDPAKP